MKKLLIVDDDKIFLKIFQDTLNNDHPGVYDIAVAENGEEGLISIEGSRPDIIVLDIKMPKMDGIEFLRELRARAYEPQIPVLISTNLSDTEKISEGIELGVRGYVMKSDYSLDGIIKHIEDVLGTKKA